MHGQNDSHILSKTFSINQYHPHCNVSQRGSFTQRVMHQHTELVLNIVKYNMI